MRAFVAVLISGITFVLAATDYRYPLNSPNYDFGYRVSDPLKGLDFGHKEQRNSGTTTGVYYVLLPDGRKQTVRYHADKSGYRPFVTYTHQRDDKRLKSLGNKLNPYREENKHEDLRSIRPMKNSKSPKVESKINYKGSRSSKKSLRTNYIKNIDFSIKSLRGKNRTLDTGNYSYGKFLPARNRAVSSFKSSRENIRKDNTSKIPKTFFGSSENRQFPLSLKQGTGSLNPNSQDFSNQLKVINTFASSEDKKSKFHADISKDQLFKFSVSDNSNRHVAVPKDENKKSESSLNFRPSQNISKSPYKPSTFFLKSSSKSSSKQNSEDKLSVPFSLTEIDNNISGYFNPTVPFTNTFNSFTSKETTKPKKTDEEKLPVKPSLSSNEDPGISVVPRLVPVIIPVEDSIQLQAVEALGEDRFSDIFDDDSPIAFGDYLDSDYL